MNTFKPKLEYVNKSIHHAENGNRCTIHTYANLFFRAEFLICFTEIYCREGNLCLLLILFLGLLFMMDFCSLQCRRVLRTCKCFCSRKRHLSQSKTSKIIFFANTLKRSSSRANEPRNRPSSLRDPSTHILSLGDLWLFLKSFLFTSQTKTI